MKYLDNEGLLYFWQKIKSQIAGSSDNNYTDEDKAKVDKIVSNGDGTKYLADNGVYQTVEVKVDDVKVNGTSVVTNKVANIDLTGYAEKTDVKTTTDALNVRIETLENLGSYVGAFDTVADLPANISALANVTINDFATVRADETKDNAPTRHVVKAINESTGAITWGYDFTYSSDVTGKMDLVNGAVENNLASYSTGGQVKDSGKKLSDLVLGADLVAITNAEIDTITAD